MMKTSTQKDTEKESKPVEIQAWGAVEIAKKSICKNPRFLSKHKGVMKVLCLSPYLFFGCATTGCLRIFCVLVTRMLLQYTDPWLQSQYVCV